MLPSYHWRELIRPKSLDLDKESLTHQYGQFVLKPLERGFGLTLGHSLRRVLLTALPGTAVVGVKINGVTADSSTVPNVTETLEELLLNFKELRFSTTATDVIVKIERSNAGIVTGADVQVTGDVQVLNPDQVLAHVSGSFKAEILIHRGKGYEATEERRSTLPAGFTAVDSFFSPVRRVNLQVTQTRVGERTDYDKLSMEVWTDGSVKPDEAVNMSSKILRDQLAILMNFEDVEESSETSMDASSPAYNRNLLRSVDEFELSVRSSNCLQTMGVRYIWQLVQKTEADIMKTRNMGRKSLNEINDLLQNLGLGLGMKLDGFTPPEAPAHAPDSDIDESRILKDRLDGDEAEDEDFGDDFED